MMHWSRSRPARRPAAREAENVAEGIVLASGQAVARLLRQNVTEQTEGNVVVVPDLALPVEVAVEYRPFIKRIPELVAAAELMGNALGAAEVTLSAIPGAVRGLLCRRSLGNAHGDSRSLPVIKKLCMPRFISTSRALAS